MLVLDARINYKKLRRCLTCKKPMVNEKTDYCSGKCAMKMKRMITGTPEIQKEAEGLVAYCKDPKNWKPVEINTYTPKDNLFITSPVLSKEEKKAAKKKVKKKEATNATSGDNEQREKAEEESSGPIIHGT